MTLKKKHKRSREKNEENLRWLMYNNKRNYLRIKMKKKGMREMGKNTCSRNNN